MSARLGVAHDLSVRAGYWGQYIWLSAPVITSLHHPFIISLPQSLNLSAALAALSKQAALSYDWNVTDINFHGGMVCETISVLY